MDWPPTPAPAPPQSNCNLKSVRSKYCYCRRRNQTFMRERELGRSSESRSRMCSHVSETAALLSPPLPPALSSQLFPFFLVSSCPSSLPSFSPLFCIPLLSLLFCPLLSPQLFNTSCSPPSFSCGTCFLSHQSQDITRTLTHICSALLTIISQGEGHVVSAFTTISQPTVAATLGARPRCRGGRGGRR